MTREEAIRRARAEIEEATRRLLETAFYDDQWDETLIANEMALLEDGALADLHSAASHTGAARERKGRYPIDFTPHPKDPSKGDR